MALFILFTQLSSTKNFYENYNRNNISNSGRPHSWLR